MRIHIKAKGHRAFDSTSDVDGSYNRSFNAPRGALRMGGLVEGWKRNWDLGLQAGIWASRLGFGPQGRNLGLEAGI